MLFSSYSFLFLFLPATLLIYYLVPYKYRNWALFLFSLLFYGWDPAERMNLILLVLVFSLDYGASLLIGLLRNRGKQQWTRCIFIITICLNIGCLAFFKYANFVIENLNRIPTVSLEILPIRLPLGISFYTFQALSYVIDVYREKVSVQKSYLKFGTYVILFPQLIAGPIIQYKDLEKELVGRTYSWQLAASGAYTFVCGLGKKVILANTAGALWEGIYRLPKSEMTTVSAWMGLILFSMQIYFDFSGYSDMAIGLGKMLGFHFPENFNYPYLANSITDFWRRWHMTLSSWFRDYVYIPLGGNRVGKVRLVLNLLVVWALTGFWHGASWNFLLWGLYYFLILTIEKLFLGKYLARCPHPIQHLYALFFIFMGWLLFAFDGSNTYLAFSQFGIYLGYLFGVGVNAFSSGYARYEIVRNLSFFFILVAACLPYPKLLWKRLNERYPWTNYLSAILGFVLLGLCVAYLADESYNPFLYWKF